MSVSYRLADGRLAAGWRQDTWPDETVVFPGTLIPKNCVETLKETLSSDAVSVTEQTFEHPDALK